ncbi:MAG: YegS/Rv2252/BmrU family lipid kinase [Mogibacterium sp.]|nr:YegS/Rv2252/BmrU family lipid kinase [Mogibacterium sp.]
MTERARRKKLLFIMNPKSGVMLAPKHMAEIVGIFSNAGYLTEVLMTRGKGDARDFASEYGGEASIVAISGGDGTFNEVVDGLIRAGHKTPIGYIPAGSTNDFAHSIGLPKQILDCAGIIVNGSPISVDIGSFNDRKFSYVASFGAFTSATYSVPQNLKNIFGHAAYIMTGIKEIAELKPIHAKFISDKDTSYAKVYEGDYVIGAICNSRSVGGILHLENLGVDMNDGHMEVLLVKMPTDIIQLSEIAVSMLSGTFQSDQIESFTTSNLEVEIQDGVHWTLDGEYEEGRERCEIKILPSAISVIK